MEVPDVVAREAAAVARVNWTERAAVDGCLATQLEKLAVGRDEFILHGGLPDGVPQKHLSEPRRKLKRPQGVFVRCAAVQVADTFEAQPQIVKDQEADCCAEGCVATLVFTRHNVCERVLALDRIERVAQQADIVVRLIELVADRPQQIGTGGGARRGTGKLIVVLPHPKAVEQNLAMTQGQDEGELPGRDLPFPIREPDGSRSVLVPAQLQRGEPRVRRRRHRLMQRHRVLGQSARDGLALGTVVYIVRSPQWLSEVAVALRTGFRMPDLWGVPGEIDEPGNPSPFRRDRLQELDVIALGIFRIRGPGHDKAGIGTPGDDSWMARGNKVHSRARRVMDGNEVSLVQGRQRLYESLDRRDLLLRHEVDDTVLGHRLRQCRRDVLSLGRDREQRNQQHDRERCEDGLQDRRHGSEKDKKGPSARSASGGGGRRASAGGPAELSSAT